MKQAVIGIVLAENRTRMLVTKRRDVPIWTLISGGVDEGETLEQAVIREVEEETGIQAKIKRKVAEFSPICKLAALTHVFECEPVSGAPQISNETEKVDFFPIDSLPQPFFELHKIWLDIALENRSEILKRPLFEVSYSALFLYLLKHPIWVIRITLSRLGMPINKL